MVTGTYHWGRFCRCLGWWGLSSPQGRVRWATHVCRYALVTSDCTGRTCRQTTWLSSQRTTWPTYRIVTGRADRISRVQASFEEGRELDSQLSQINDLQSIFLSLPSQALCNSITNRAWQHLKMKNRKMLKMQAPEDFWTYALIWDKYIRWTLLTH